MAKAAETHGADAKRYKWTTYPDMPTARCYSIAAYHDRKLYVFGMCVCVCGCVDGSVGGVGGW